MTIVTINAENIAPNLHPNRQNCSTYFSYIRRWASQCESRYFPLTMRDYERCMLSSGINRFLGEGFDFDTASPPLIGILNADVIADILCRTNILRIFETNRRLNTNRLNVNMTIVKLIAALNIFSQFAEGYNHPIRHKVDFIQTVGDRHINDRSWDMAGSSMARISANFNGRCVLRITDEELQDFTNIDSAQAFLRKAGMLYLTIPLVSACCHPRYTRISQTTRTDGPRSTRGIGGHTGRRREVVESVDIPNGRLANEYQNRQDIDDSIPQNQLAAMLQIMELPSDVCNQIHELLLATQMNCEEIAEVGIAS